MIDKTPVYYDFYGEDAMNEVCGFLDEEFGGDGAGGMIAHELVSEYVHTDVGVYESEEGIRTFATFGMGARETNSPLREFRRVELLLTAAPKEEDEPEINTRILCSELQHLSKFPFKENTWFGPGHTVNASETFRETFGYSFFFFLQYHHSLEVKRVGEVRFLLAIPIYEDEREWIVSHENGSARFAKALIAGLRDDEPIGYADVERRHVIPEA